MRSKAESESVGVAIAAALKMLGEHVCEVGDARVLDAEQILRRELGESRSPFVASAVFDARLRPGARTEQVFRSIVQYRDRFYDAPTGMRMHEETLRSLGHEWGVADTDDDGCLRDWSAPGSTLFGLPITVDDTLPVGRVTLTPDRSRYTVLPTVSFVDPDTPKPRRAR